MFLMPFTQRQALARGYWATHDVYKKSLLAGCTLDSHITEALHLAWQACK